MRTFTTIARLPQRSGRLSPKYFVRYYDKSTKRRGWLTTSCDRLKDARAWVKAQERDQALGKDIVTLRHAQEITLSEAIAEWSAHKADTVASAFLANLKTYRDNWLAYFRGKALAELNREEIERYLRRRLKGTIGVSRGKPVRPVTATTVNNELRVLRNLMSYCVERGWLTFSPAQRIKPLSGEMRRRTRTLSFDEEARLLEACRHAPPITICAKRNAGGVHGGTTTVDKRTFEQSAPPPDYLAPLVITALYTGLRRRTLMSLEWRHIDFANRRIWIPAELMKAGEDFEAPLHATVLSELEAWRTRLASKPVANIHRLAGSARVFGLTPNSSVYKSFQGACKRANLNLTLHDLRRCFINRLRAAGVGIDVVMTLSDHRSLQTVLRHYVGHTESQKTAAMRQLERLGASHCTAIGTNAPN